MQDEATGEVLRYAMAVAGVVVAGRTGRGRSRGQREVGEPGKEQGVGEKKQQMGKGWGSDRGRGKGRE